MKSFFDFIGRTEATRGARRWSWIKKTSLSYSQSIIFYKFLKQEKSQN
ncbi:hypothetical protein LC048_14635 [Mesobacillus subterraneus]|nr:hypothetical protein [Mesobacillus subterraneus]WLR53752.1 hypothetical protein LC048_14635 [Mesobacillus subterraneus]